ncbi:MAG: methylated-DNA--[protein]-cysteine S-methyltransferase [Corynebacterium sp.]|nr:methylated-DNA--[protein]-cysteine S-methyltransferase [Corynebacterium sp.]
MIIFMNWNPLQVDCPSHKLLRTVTGRWPTLIISALSQGPLRFGELRENIAGISDKMLAQSLKDLKNSAIIEQDQAGSYRLTDVGASFTAPLSEILEWVKRNMDEVIARQPATRYFQNSEFGIQVDASPLGLTKVSFVKKPRGDVFDNDDSPAARHADEAVRELGKFFENPKYQPRAVLDWSVVQKDFEEHSFRYQVWRFLENAKPGETYSYAEVAAAVGSSGAMRAVGTACKKNPWPIFIPCHRVIKSDGSFGDYVGGADTKQWLLNFEKGAI